MSDQMTPEQINRWAAEQDGWECQLNMIVHFPADRSIKGWPAIPDYYHDLNEAVAFAEKHGVTWSVNV